MIIKPGVYRHYKGGNYKVIGLARHSETLEELVIYEALYANPKSKLWARPKKMFLEKILGEKRKKKVAIVVGLSGDLGAGKTTFVQAVAKHLGVKNKVNSPTFVIIKKYSLKNKKHKFPVAERQFFYFFGQRRTAAGYYGGFIQNHAAFFLGIFGKEKQVINQHYSGNAGADPEYAVNTKSQAVYSGETQVQKQIRCA